MMLTHVLTLWFGGIQKPIEGNVFKRGGLCNIIRTFKISEIFNYLYLRYVIVMCKEDGLFIYTYVLDDEKTK
jgi:hypothetical protein